MNIWVPYTRLQPATAVSLRLHDVNYCPVNDYVTYFKDRWAENATFLNIEHDVVVWPGAVEQIWFCRKPWCAFGYQPHDKFSDRNRSLFPYLGCVKFSAELIRATPDFWDDAEGWETLDKYVAERLWSLDYDIHQHFPPVVNANPLLLGDR